MDKFHNDLTRRIFEGERIKGLPDDLMRRAKIKIFHVLAARDIRTLAIPPANRLEKLSGSRDGQWSIRVNDKYRICFNWFDGKASNIEFVDYH
ncbi:MAG: type II toxin-antitoxin system RelE/ParE family toxin [Spirochaetaceae bacterium]|nr:type II toxin-antitoxin system RelE/ParE family toxin [Spirochaetaceae bacterium]